MARNSSVTVEFEIGQCVTACGANSSGQTYHLRATGCLECEKGNSTGHGTGCPTGRSVMFAVYADHETPCGGARFSYNAVCEEDTCCAPLVPGLPAHPHVFIKGGTTCAAAVTPAPTPAPTPRPTDCNTPRTCQQDCLCQGKHNCQMCMNGNKCIRCS